MKAKLTDIINRIKYWDEESPDTTFLMNSPSSEIISDDNDESRRDNLRLIHRVLYVHPERRLTHGIIRFMSGLYLVSAIAVCTLLSLLLIYTAFKLPPFGVTDTPSHNEVYERYLEHTVDETGAINAVSGMILDYRAFDTLGESHVLFTALMCVMILLKDTPTSKIFSEDEKYFDLVYDVPLKSSIKLIIPFIFMFGIYIILAGHLGPGGGFAGGAFLGAGMILLSCAWGDKKIGVFFGKKTFKAVTCTALCFYSLSKTYSFFTGANGIESIIPKGIPGAILSGGLILPLNIAVGMVVACTMFGFYSLFTKGNI